MRNDELLQDTDDNTTIYDQTIVLLNNIKKKREKKIIPQNEAALSINYKCLPSIVLFVTNLCATNNNQQKKMKKETI